jgi:methyltransferase OMS1, mitochondrial
MQGDEVITFISAGLYRGTWRPFLSATRRHRNPSSPNVALMMEFSSPVTISRRRLLESALGLALLWPVPVRALEVDRKEPQGQPYDNYADAYDVLDGANAALPSALGFPERRRETVSRASGNVLEVGCGTGANFPIYVKFGVHVTSLTGLDISEGMLARARFVRDSLHHSNTSSDRQSLRIDLVQGDVAALPFDDESFDTVVDTFSLCVFPDPDSSLREMRRVLKKSSQARMLLLEHSISSLGPLATFQNVTASTVARSSKGCFWNQDVARSAERAGLVVVSQNEYLAGTVRLFELRRNDMVLVSH